MKFTLSIEPKAQMRPRFCRTGRTYKHKSQVMAEESILTMLAPHQPPEPFTDPLMLGVKCYLPIPKSKPKKFKAAAQAGEIRPTSKPDLDNLLKNIKDCLTSMRFWTDDKLVVGYLPDTGKLYDDGAGPRWEVEIKPLEQEA